MKRRIGFAGALLPLAAILLLGFCLPVLAMLVYGLGAAEASTVAPSYYISGVIRSALLASAALLMAGLLSVPLVASFPCLSARSRGLLLLVMAMQVQVGLIPRVYGYLGLFSSSGLVGLGGRYLVGAGFESPLAYTPVGAAISMVVIYGPFFFLPLLAKLARTPHNLVLAVFDLGGGWSGMLRVLVRNHLRWNIVSYGSLFFLLSFFDFACSDLVGGGKVDALGKTLYRSVTLFQDYRGSAVVGSLLMIAMLALAAGLRTRKEPA